MENVLVLCVNAVDEATPSSGFDLWNGFGVKPRFEDLKSIGDLFLHEENHGYSFFEACLVEDTIGIDDMCASNQNEPPPRRGVG